MKAVSSLLLLGSIFQGRCGFRTSTSIKFLYLVPPVIHLSACLCKPPPFFKLFC